jgi:hypothetical protein
LNASFLIIASLISAGCSTITGDATERRVVYACNYGPNLTVTFAPSEARIESSDGTVTLRQRRPPGPGFWYQSATHSLRGDGDDIIYIDRQMAPKHCHATR